MNADLARHLEALERELLDSSVRHNRTRLVALLAPDFREVGASGRSYDREAIIEALLREETRQIRFSELHCRLVNEHCALLTYRSHQPDEPALPYVRRMSLWVLREKAWQMLYHQGTREPSA